MTKSLEKINWGQWIAVISLLIGLGITWASLPASIMEKAETKFVSKEVFQSEMRHISKSLTRIEKKLDKAVLVPAGK